MRPTVCVLADTPGWAFDSISKILQRDLADEFTIFGKYYPEITKETHADAVIWLWHASFYDLYQFFPPGCKHLVCLYDEHVYSQGENFQKLCYAAEHCDMLLLSSKPQRCRVLPLLPVPKQVGFCQDGVDTAMFPATPYRDNLLAGPLRIGWMGSSNSFYNGDIKGLGLIREAISRVKNTQLVLQDKEVKLIPKNEMHRWYAGIDVGVCFSSAEGTPNVVTESASCGRAWISTDVGIVQEFFNGALQLGEKTNSGFITTREVATLENLLRYINSNRNMLPEMGRVGRHVVKAYWDWKIRSESFRRALKRVL